MPRQEPAAAHAVFRIAFRGRDTPDELRSGPDAPGILPAAAAAAEPLAEDGPRRHEPPFGFGELPGERCRLSGGPHAGGDQRREQIRGYGKPRSLRDVVDAADELEAQARTDNAFEERRQVFARSLHTRGHDPGRDHRRLQEAEIVAGKIKHLREIGDLGRCAQVHAREPQHGFVDHPQVGFDRRLWGRIATMYGEVDRHVEHPRPLGKVHPEEEDVAPPGMREIHPDGRRFPKHRIHARAIRPDGRLGEQFRPDAQGVIGGMANAKHPLVAAKAADAPPHLIGQRLEPEIAIRCREGAGDRVRRSVGFLRRKESLDRLLEPPVQQMLVALVGNQRGIEMADPTALSLRKPNRVSDSAFRKPNRVSDGDLPCQPCRHVKPVDRVEKKQCPHAFVEVAAFAAKPLERGALPEQLLERSPSTHGLHRLIPRGRVGGGDDRDEPRWHGGGHGQRACGCRARSSTICARISVRSWPASPRASWATSRPYVSPRLKRRP